MQKTKIAAEELAEMIRDGLAEEGHDVQVRPNPETGWDVAVISANEAQDAGIRAEVIAAALRRRYDWRSNINEGGFRRPLLCCRRSPSRSAPERRMPDAARRDGRV